jgi:hypothetical protein
VSHRGSYLGLSPRTFPISYLPFPFCFFAVAVDVESTGDQLIPNAWSLDSACYGSQVPFAVGSRWSAVSHFARGTHLPPFSSLPLGSMRYQRGRPVTRSGWSLDSACYGPQVRWCLSSRWSGTRIVLQYLLLRLSEPLRSPISFPFSFFAVAVDAVSTDEPVIRMGFVT